MPLQSYPKFKAVPDKMLEIPNPAMGGINLRDLEFEQEVNQSPYMLNVMYRNGAFGKRFGQEIHSTYADTVYASVYFDGDIYVHAGKKIYKKAENSSPVDVSGLIVFPESKGIFIVYAQKLYYLVSSGFYILDTTFKTISAYVPDLFINCKPDGSHSDAVDEFNLMSDNFSLIYNGDGASTTYTVSNYDSNEVIDWNSAIKVYYDDEEVTQDSTNPPAANKCYIDKTNKQIIFGTAPADGDLNVKITFTMKSTTFSTERSQILSCKFYDTFGGANNSRLFIAGCGYSKYFYTASYDISYFPESNFATLGNTEEDITGFGRQYNVLIVFKPREVYSIYSYTETSSTTVIEENIGLEAFKSQLVNAMIGCDAPYSIQLVNNLLTWFNSSYGICTLTSTNIQDERNVRTISRNIDYTNNFGVKGIMDYDEDLTKIQSVDYENKYFLVFPTSGYCFMWDYEIQPYVITSRGETDPRKLCWYLFDHFYVHQFLKVGTQLLYISNHNGVHEEVVEQRILNGNFATTDSWEVLGNATFTVSDNVGYVTVSQAGDGIRQTVLVNCKEDYYLSGTVKNTSPVTIADFDGNSNEFVRHTNIVNLDEPPFETTPLEIYFVLTEDLDIPATIEIKDFMLFRMKDFSVPVTKEALDSYITGYNDGHIDFGTDFRKTLIKLNSSFNDLDFNGDGVADPIHCYYQTPFMQFGAVEMLKNVNNVYIQSRGDINSKIDLYYYTNDSADGEPDLEPIQVGGHGVLWDNFTWDNFIWQINSWGNTVRRKCNLKKIQMASIYFEDNENADMSVTHVGMQYQLVKYIR